MEVQVLFAATTKRIIVPAIILFKFPRDERGVLPAGTAKAAVRFPTQGARFILDPTVPRRFQTIALEAVITPQISQVVWIINGKEYGRASYPYTLRWPLQEGEFQVQVRFPNAHVESPPVTFRVIP